jgi:hypothetical protein
MRNSSARNNSLRGVTAANHSTGTVDNRVLESSQDSALAPNGGNLYITTSTIQNNTQFGVLASRNSLVRIGQDIGPSACRVPGSDRASECRKSFQFEADAKPLGR